VLFNSIEFLFFFLPVVLSGFLLLRRLQDNRVLIAWLTLSSLFFYGWWNPVYLLLIGLSAAVNFTLGRKLSQGGGRAWLALGVLFNLGLLAYFKYANFFIENITLLLEIDFNFEHIVLPLAISFYTFQQITYLVDSSKGRTEAHSFLEYSLFVSFFPQLIAGPIVHHSDMLSQFQGLHKVEYSYRNFAIAWSIIAIGLFKKVVVADSFALFSTPVFTLAADGHALYSLDALAGIFSYAFQLYFDFSGYSDMAIGLGCLFGIKLPVNFFSPFRAQNISDFWRMWHATLSRFLRDYVYTPLGGFVCSPRRQRFNLFVTMFVGGVWHGAGWTFVVYGLLHGVYVVIHQLWRVRVSGPREWLGNKHYRMAAQVFTFLVVVFTLVFFRSSSLAAASHLMVSVFQFEGYSFSADYLAQLNRSNLFKLTRILVADVQAVQLVYAMLLMALVACWALPSTLQLFERQEVAIVKPRAGRAAVIRLQWQPGSAWAAFIAVLVLMSLLNLTQVSEFLYFQF
jgi:D-alanyl-lipoteichoic acid acyltransferase DltB (MBOAT superfamily)